MSVEEQVAAHYGSKTLLAAIRDGLKALGKDVEHPTVEDLAPVDHYHGGGLGSTQKMAERLNRYAKIKPGDSLLDLGSGIGGPARFFATTFDCQLTGIDLTPEFCHAAEALNEMTGLSDRVRIHNGSATDLPFEADTFHHAYSQNVSMNIEDKASFHSEAARVLKPGGCFALTEVVTGPGGDILFPNPYARTPENSFVVSLESTISSLTIAGFEILLLVNTSDRSRQAHTERRDDAEAGDLPPLGVHLIMGEDALELMRNSAANTVEARAVPYTFICRKR
jgi:SAM-dependent methyltransferase